MVLWWDLFIAAERETKCWYSSQQICSCMRAAGDFQGVAVMDSLLWLVSLSADTRELQGHEKLWVREALKQRWTRPSKWEVTGFVWSPVLTDTHDRCKSSFLSFSYSISEEKADQNLSRLELFTLYQNKEKCYG